MYKIENGKLIKSTNAVRRTIKGKEFITTNPTEAILSELGWKHYAEQEKPTPTEYQLIKEVLEDGATIVKRYEVEEKPIINDPEPALEEGYELQPYEYITDTEVHRGKRLVKLQEQNEEEVVEQATEEFQESDGASSESEDNGTAGSGDNVAD